MTIEQLEALRTRAFELTNAAASLYAHACALEALSVGKPGEWQRELDAQRKGDDVATAAAAVLERAEKIARDLEQWGVGNV